MKTLIVDDEGYNRAFLKYMLRPYDECIEAEDGLEGVALLIT